MESRSFFLRNCNSSCKLFQCYGSPEMTNKRLNIHLSWIWRLAPWKSMLGRWRSFWRKRPIFRGWILVSGSVISIHGSWWFYPPNGYFWITNHEPEIWWMGHGKGNSFKMWPLLGYSYQFGKVWRAYEIIDQSAKTRNKKPCEAIMALRWTFLERMRRMLVVFFGT